MYIPSNYSFEEALKIVDIPRELLPYLDSLYDKIITLDVQIKQEEKAYELLQEQEGNANDLIERLLYTIRNGTSLKQVKKQVELDVENSYYEL